MSQWRELNAVRFGGGLFIIQEDFGYKENPQHVYFMYLGPRKLYKKAPSDTYMMSNLCKIKTKRNYVTAVLLWSLLMSFLSLCESVRHMIGWHLPISLQKIFGILPWRRCGVPAVENGEGQLLTLLFSNVLIVTFNELVFFCLPLVQQAAHWESSQSFHSGTASQ